MKNIKYISYYTEEYESVINKYLLPTLKKHKLDYHISKIHSMGTHQINANYKPQFIYSMMQLYPNNNFCFLDADAEILNYPVLFDEINCDIAFHLLNRAEWYNNKLDTRKEILPGTLLIKNTQKTQSLMRFWSYLALNDTKFKRKFDGKSLEHLLYNTSKYGSFTKIYYLPISYCWIKSLPRRQKHNVDKPEKIYIQHNQVSRQYRGKVRNWNKYEDEILKGLE